ncbi:MAG: FtsW/RodA/SpoVE family cell cycle protein [Planctomycetota bacterium]
MSFTLRVIEKTGPLAGLIRGTNAAATGMHASLRVLNPAWLCVLAAIPLTALGVYTIDIAETTRPLAGFDLASIAWKQVVFGIIGMLAATLIALPHHRLVGLLAWPGLIAVIALLIFLLVPFAPAALVTPRNGARSWIDLGPIDLQPSELCKVAYVVVIARYLRRRSTHRSLSGLIIPGVITAIPVGLITLQPDLGTASLFVPSLFAMLVAAGARLRHLTLIVLCAALAAPAVYPVLKPHQKERIVGLVKQFQGDTSGDQGVNFQGATAQTLIGAGGLSGASDDAARALVRYNRLPERHNDTVFAVLVTRLGFLGGAAMLALYLVWLLGALLTAGICRDPEARIIGVGLAGFVAAQVIVNIGMNLGLLPIIGVTLPFVSYGGSSLVTTWIMTGLIMNTGLHRPRPPFHNSFEYPDADEHTARPIRTGRPGDRTIGAGWRAATR